MGDKSSYGRNMNIVYGDPSIAMDGYEGRPVVDFDGISVNINPL